MKIALLMEIEKEYPGKDFIMQNYKIHKPIGLKERKNKEFIRVKFSKRFKNLRAVETRELIVWEFSNKVIFNSQNFIKKGSRLFHRNNMALRNSFISFRIVKI